MLITKVQEHQDMLEIKEECDSIGAITIDYSHGTYNNLLILYRNMYFSITPKYINDTYAGFQINVYAKNGVNKYVHVERYPSYELKTIKHHRYEVTNERYSQRIFSDFVGIVNGTTVMNYMKSLLNKEQTKIFMDLDYIQHVEESVYRFVGHNSKFFEFNTETLIVE